MKNNTHFILAILLLFLPITIFAETTFMYDGLQFKTLNDKTCEVTAIVTNNEDDSYNHEYSELLSGELILPEYPTNNGKVYTLTEIDETAFISCHKLTSVVIPNSVLKIGAHAFEWCTGITSLTIGDSVTEIGNSAFSECTSLIFVNIPNSVISIDNNAFDGCSELTDIIIGNSVTTIGNKAFLDCTSIKNIYYLPSTGIEANENIFDKSVYDNACLYANYDIIYTVSPWNKFIHRDITTNTELIEINEHSKIPVSIYTLYGTKINDNIKNLPKGVYIIKIGDKVDKVIKK
jgi:hypothetical protein